MNRHHLPRLGAALLLSAGLLGAAGAQAPAKPAPAADAKTRTLGGGSGGTGKLMTYDELSACLKQQESLNSRRLQVEAAQAPLEADKQALVIEQAALKAERAKVDEAQQSVRDLNARYKAHAERVSAWNERSKEVADMTGRNADRERERLDRERAEIEKTQGALEAERTKIGDAPQQAINSFNTKAGDLDARVAAWNLRNAGHAAEARSVNEEREVWIGECANRRYREDDETAIRRGN